VASVEPGFSRILAQVVFLQEPVDLLHSGPGANQTPTIGARQELLDHRQRMNHFVAKSVEQLFLILPRKSGRGYAAIRSASAGDR